jgi:hypothetical protein
MTPSQAVSEALMQKGQGNIQASLGGVFAKAPLVCPDSATLMDDIRHIANMG